MKPDPVAVGPSPARLRFEALVRERMRQPFAWGAHDCCLWAADAVAALTGRDLAADWRGRYRTALEAARLVRELGGLRAIGALAGPPVAPLRATVGDVGLVQLGMDEMLAVCAGPCWLVPATGGLSAHDLSAAVAAWRPRRA